MSIVSDSLNILDSARALLSDVGLRPYRVSVRVTKWKESLGVGPKTVTDTELTVADGKPPKVRQLSAKEIVASGGQLGDLMLEVGPLTPPYTGGGVETSDITPETNAFEQEVQYIVFGPGMPSDGALFSKVSDKFDSPFRYMFTIKKTGVNV